MLAAAALVSWGMYQGQVENNAMPLGECTKGRQKAMQCHFWNNVATTM